MPQQPSARLLINKHQLTQMRIEDLVLPVTLAAVKSYWPQTCSS